MNSGNRVSLINPQLAEKLHEVRNRAEQHGQVFTNAPRERFADARFDDKPSSVAIPVLRKDGFEFSQVNSPAQVPRSARRASRDRYTLGDPASPTFHSPQSYDPEETLRVESAGTVRVDYPLPYTEQHMTCSKCYTPEEMRQLYVLDCVSNILTHACSLCGVALSQSPAIRSISPDYPFPVAHECESCGWRVCIRCDIIENVQKGLARLKAQTEAETVEAYEAKIKLLEQEMQHVSETEPSLTAAPRIPSPSGSSSGSCTPPLVESYRDRILELENKVSLDRKSREQLSALISSLQKEYMQYKTDAEMHMESNAAEQILLQSRLIEQSVLLADARARIDELTSVQRRTPSSPSKSGGGALSQREALLINDNNQLKEEIDCLKISMHAEFDNWKRTVLKQVRNECIKYRDRLRKNLLRMDDDTNGTVTNTHDGEEQNPSSDDLLNEKELDYLFDEVDWTGDMQQLDMTPDKLRQHVAANAVRRPDSPTG